MSIFFGKQPKKKKALFLTGGGARGAYQAGVLKAIGEIAKSENIPFDIISGMSAGSINAAFLASRAENFSQGTVQLEKIWANLSSKDVFNVKLIPLIWAVMRTMLEVMVHVTPREGQYFLDTTPLSKFLAKKINYEQLNKNLTKELLESFEVSTVCYETGEHVSFYNSCNHLKEHARFRYKTKRSIITNQHILASSALPLFFRPIKIDKYHYGDGALRNFYPLRSAIALGADSFLVIDVKELRPNIMPTVDDEKSGVSFGRILNLFFNTVFLDSIDRDLEMLETINQNVAAIREKEKAKMIFREINTLCIRPSQNLGSLAAEHVKALPMLLRYLLMTFGSKEQAADIISYLLFESEYCKLLIDIGYQDAMRQETDIYNYLVQED